MIHIELDRSGTDEGFRQIITQLQKNSDVKGLFILSCDANGFAKDVLDEILLDISTPLFGGVFPGILYNNELLERGTIVVGLSTEPQVHVVKDLSSNISNYDADLENKFSHINKNKTMFVIVDGMSTRINTLIESMFNMLGLDINYIGGGASSLDFVRKPCIFTNSGLQQDCAILALAEMVSGVGIKHGMQSISGPYKITEAKDNIVYSLNWQPASQLYNDIITNHPDYNPGNYWIFGSDGQFSFGLNRYEAEKVIMEPAGKGDNDSLIFMQEIREGELVDIMHITAESTINSAQRALESAEHSLKVKTEDATVVFDCVSRKMFLEDRFQEEINVLYDGDKPLIGVLTFGGEIGSSGMDCLDYHNRTCVVGVIGEPEE